MKQKFIILFVLFILFMMVLFVPSYLQAQETEIFRQEGIASWYGKEFDGRPTASGEIFDSSQLTAAHPNLPFGTTLVVTNRHNNKKVTVRVTDRGPFVAARIIDVSKAAAEQLDMIVTGTAPVSIESVDRIVTKPAGVSKPVQETVVQTAPPAAVTEVPQAPVYTPVITTTTVTAPTTAPAPQVISYAPVTETYAAPPAAAQVSYRVKLTPEISVMQNKSYRLQVGSYKVARNAVDAFERLKNAGLNPAYERHTEPEKGEFFRVVLAGVQGTDVQLTAEKLGTAGFREALIREEN
ncbi:MAG: septal ring lytic transglycosylase RlpA family protein [Treponema sp.]|jgi:rare lipoprotein A|nr:septal ring lytic transglycosylase RlpA family protein [Treponema sp.]